MCVPDSQNCSIVGHYITEPGSALIFLLEKFIIKCGIAFTTLRWDYFLGKFLPHKTGTSSGIKAMTCFIFESLSLYVPGTFLRVRW